MIQSGQKRAKWSEMSKNSNFSPAATATAASTTEQHPATAARRGCRERRAGLRVGLGGWRQNCQWRVQLYDWRGGPVRERQNAQKPPREGECRCQPRDGADRAGRAALAAGRADVRTERVAEWRDKQRGPAYSTTDDCACRTAAARSARGQP